MDTNKSYTSKIINDYSNKNYNNFVNEYRVNEARKLLTEKENWSFTIEFIASKVGFKSKSTFNIAFKKFTGITPSYFLSSVRNNKEGNSI
ncbi:MAG: AraC family transcriptional regulator [Flavobacteriaceae bacterium]|nr:AraC family transcriptional regulator [Flavobacteriaceae bacterium]